MAELLYKYNKRYRNITTIQKKQFKLHLTLTINNLFVIIKSKLILVLEDRNAAL